MSHTTTITGVKITDVDVLKRTIAQLQKSGVRCELVENATPRAFYTDQKGLGPADFVIRLADSPYDVGLYKTTDETGKTYYEPRADLYSGRVQAVLGNSSLPNDDVRSHVSRLMAEYSAQAAMKQAVMRGYKVQRIDRKDGSIQLQVIA